MFFFIYLCWFLDPTPEKDINKTGFCCLSACASLRDA